MSYLFIYLIGWAFCTVILASDMEEPEWGLALALFWPLAAVAFVILFVGIPLAGLGAWIGKTLRGDA